MPPNRTKLWRFLQQRLDPEQQEKLLTWRDALLHRQHCQWLFTSFQNAPDVSAVRVARIQDLLLAHQAYHAWEAAQRQRSVALENALAVEKNALEEWQQVCRKQRVFQWLLDKENELRQLWELKQEQAMLDEFGARRRTVWEDAE